jgi:hypothetical protein
MTPEQIDAIARQISALDADSPDYQTKLDAIAAPLSSPDIVAVQARLRAEAAASLVEAFEALERLTHAAGMPKGVIALPWLAKRGLAKKTVNGWMIRTLPLRGNGWVELPKSVEVSKP